MTRIQAFAGFARLIFAFSEPQSPPPVPTPSPESEVKQEQSAGETPASNQTEKPAFTTGKNDESANSQSRKDNDKSPSNWSLIFAGIVAAGALVQMGAVFVQAYLTRRQLR